MSRHVKATKPPTIVWHIAVTKMANGHASVQVGGGMRQICGNLERADALATATARAAVRNDEADRVTVFYFEPDGKTITRPAKAHLNRHHDE